MSRLTQQFAQFSRRFPRLTLAGNVLSAMTVSTLLLFGTETAPNADIAGQVGEGGWGTVIREADGSGEVRPICAWGAGGHYWAVFGIALLAGYSRQDAWRLAFLSWLPDQVDEMDAAYLYTMYLRLRASETVSDMGLAASMARGTIILLRPPRQTENTNLALQLDFPALEDLPLRRYVDIIHKGLHCLNGNLAEAETLRRQENSLRHAEGERYDDLFGISLHSFGDSFAHREVEFSGDQRMYEAGMGHSVEAFSSAVPRRNREWFRRHGGGDYDFDDPELKGHAVDYLDFRPENTTNYVVALYNLFMEATGRPEPRRPTQRTEFLSGWPQEHQSSRGTTNPTPREWGSILAEEYGRDVLSQSHSDRDAGVRTRDWAFELWGNSIGGDEWNYDPHRSHSAWSTFHRTNPGALRLRFQYRDLEAWLATVTRWASQ